MSASLALCSEGQPVYPSLSGSKGTRLDSGLRMGGSRDVPEQADSCDLDLSFVICKGFFISSVLVVGLVVNVESL